MIIMVLNGLNSTDSRTIVEYGLMAFFLVVIGLIMPVLYNVRLKKKNVIEGEIVSITNINEDDTLVTTEFHLNNIKYVIEEKIRDATRFSEGMKVAVYLNKKDLFKSSIKGFIKFNQFVGVLFFIFLFIFIVLKILKIW